MEGSNDLMATGQLALLTIALLIVLSASFAAYRMGYFSHAIDDEIIKEKLSIFQVLGGFLAFVFIQIIAVPIFLLSYFLITTGSLPTRDNLNFSQEAQGWLTIVIMILSFLAVACYFSLQASRTKLVILSRGETKTFFANMKSFFVGVVAWLFAYPMVFFVGRGIGLLIYYFTGEAEIEQVAVKSLKATEHIPTLFASMVLGVVVFIPIMEELLFRGFLQTWLRGKMRTYSAIGVTSIVFALFHYSFSQGFSNIAYMAALLFLSGILGYLYEREKSLWASIGLHVMFNAVSVLLTVLL
jgi:uncharacterized protein